MGGNNPQIQVPLGAAKMQVTAYDTLSVTSTYSDASGNALGSVILVQGSPFVTYTAAADQTIALEPVFRRGATRCLHQHGCRSRVRPGGRRRRSRRRRRQGDPEVGVDHDAVRRAGRGDAASLAAAADPVVSTSVDHSVDGDTVKTTLNYVTANGGDTVIAPMAGQTVDGGNKSTGTYASIYGAMDLYTGSSLTTTAPVTEPSDELDLSTLSDEDKAAP